MSYADEVRAMRNKAENDINNRNNSDLEQKLIEKAFATMLQNLDGIKVLKTILSIAPLDSISYTNDPITLAFSEGRRSVTAEIKNLIPKHFLKNLLDDYED